MYLDLLGSVAELTERLRRERAALVRALARAREIRGGTDESGSITILLDEEGTARDIRVAADWRRRLSPADVGAAVVTADGEAARRRTAATAEALADQSTSDVDGSTEDVQAVLAVGGLGGGWLSPVAPPEPDEGSARPRRSLAEISAAVLAAFADLDRCTAPPPPVQGTGADGAVRLTLAQGRISECVINPAWLARQDDVTLAQGLREAVSAAAVASVAARRPFVEYQQRLAAIVADARAGLSSVTRGARP